jgi:hypothetical protein
MPGKRVEREVEEILERDERRSGQVRMAPPSRGRSRQLSWPRLTPGVLMISSLILVLIGFAVRDYLVQFVFAALALFAAGYFWSMQSRMRRGGRPVDGSRRQRGGREIYWRGERVDRIEPRGEAPNVVQFRPSWRDRVRRLFRR